MFCSLQAAITSMIASAAGLVVAAEHGRPISANDVAFDDRLDASAGK